MASKSIAAFIAGAIQFLRRPLFDSDTIPVWGSGEWSMVTLSELGLSTGGAVDAVARALGGVPPGATVPTGFGNLPQVLAYDGDGNLSTVTITDGTITWLQTLGYDAGSNLTTITVSTGGSTWIQTLTYTTAQLTGISAWVLQ
jgi:YD repeat-containing protein